MFFQTLRKIINSFFVLRTLEQMCVCNLRSAAAIFSFDKLTRQLTAMIACLTVKLNFCYLWPWRQALMPFLVPRQKAGIRLGERERENIKNLPKSPNTHFSLRADRRGSNQLILIDKSICHLFKRSSLFKTVQMTDAPT